MQEETFLDLPLMMASSLGEQAPEVIQALDTCLWELQSFVRFTYSSPDAVHAAAVIANQAFNDFIDLCFDLCACRGRSALREARALFEHLVNFLDVHNDADMAKRYERHGAVAAQLEAQAEYGLDRLFGNELRSARHALNKLARESKKEYENSIAEYGSQFQRGWTTSSLRDRAARHGLEKEYSFYRLASAVLHGSAGGVKGTLSSNYERPVHRTGPALELCPLAYLKGIDYFTRFIVTVAPWGPKGGERRILAALNDALQLWPAYRRAVMGMDKQIWPAEGPRQPVAVVGINRKGDKKWWLHDIDNDRIVEAQPPAEGELSGKQEEFVSQIFRDLPLPGNRDDWITVAAVGVRVVPRQGASWQPASDVLVSGEKYQYLDIHQIRRRLGS